MAQGSCPVIPKPNEALPATGFFLLKTNAPVFISDQSLAFARSYLQNELLRTKSIKLVDQSSIKKSAIQLVLTKEKMADEAYTLDISPSKITVTAADKTGLFYGVVSLLQIVDQSASTKSGTAVSCWKIIDAPRYAWRGLMLDESRHFFGKEKVKSILDWMAFYKLNRFHWHLTDEPAWRLEIKKYPLLTTIGGKGNYTDPNAEAKYYTQDDVKEIVQYAAERQITVVPEIDMPGHATAANRAYPEFSGGGSEKHPEFTFHPGKEETYAYLTGILRETTQLFPAGLLHIGGDEVSYGNEKWLTDSLVKKLMIQKKLSNEKEVERYFVQRMADSVYKMKATLLAWDEVAEANLPRDQTIIFWWRQEHPEQLALALNKGYSTVLCPRLPLYFDFVQDSTHTQGRKWNKQYNSIQDVYAFDASNLQPVTAANSKQVLGIQANVWTETMPGAERLDSMLFPRIAALAEAAWTTSQHKSFPAFKETLQKHFPLYQQEKISYYNPFR
jgi:hexosaminidase